MLLVSIFTILSCVKEEDNLVIDTQSKPMILNASTTEVVLDSNFPTTNGLTIYWEAATYTVPTEVSYKIEASNTQTFTNKYPLGTTASSIRTTSYTAKQLNDAATSLGLVADAFSDIYIRVTSYIGDKEYLALQSNPIKIRIKPYKLVYPDFYLVGAASYVGWVAANSQILYKKDNFSMIYTYLEKGANFRFLGQQDWNPINYSIDFAGIKDNYKYFKEVSSNIKKSDDTDGENMTFTGESGIYKIVIDATSTKKSLSATISSLPDFNIPQLYLVGNIAGINWTAENAVAMTKTGDGIFEYTTTLPADAEFKFLGQKSFGSLDWGNISTKGNSGFLGPKGDNDNIKFVGNGSSYKITVNLKAGTYKIQ